MIGLEKCRFSYKDSMKMKTKFFTLPLVNFLQKTRRKPCKSQKIPHVFLKGGSK